MTSHSIEIISVTNIHRDEQKIIEEVNLLPIEKERLDLDFLALNANSKLQTNGISAVEEHWIIALVNNGVNGQH